MSTTVNPWAYYNQCTGTSPQWFVQNDGSTCAFGCLPQSFGCQPPVRRRFSPYCKFMEVFPDAPQLYLRVAPSVQNDSSALTFTTALAVLELRRKGCETLIASYPAWRRDANGFIGFYFDATYFALPTGYYLGDVFIDGCYCFSITLRKPSCEAYVTDCYVQPNIGPNCEVAGCAPLDPIGIGVIGGLNCDVPDTVPFYPIEPIPPTPANCSSFVCNTPIPNTIGSTCIG